MNTPRGVEEICHEALQAVLANPDHDLKPLRRLALYQALNLNQDNYLNPGFLLLQIITAYHVLPIWQADQPENELPQTLLKIAEQVLKHPETRLQFADQLQVIWVDLEIADAGGTFPNQLKPPFSQHLRPLVPLYTVLLCGMIGNWKTLTTVMVQADWATIAQDGPT